MHQNHYLFSNLLYKMGKNKLHSQRKKKFKLQFSQEPLTVESKQKQTATREL